MSIILSGQSKLQDFFDIYNTSQTAEDIMIDIETKDHNLHAILEFSKADKSLTSI